MSITKCIAVAILALSAIWFVVGFVSNFEALHSYYARRGTIMKGLGRVLLSRWFSLILFLSGICFLYYLERGVPSWIWDRSLKMTVTSYRYSADTKELIANIQFVNNGPIRRIVSGVMFIYNPGPDSTVSATATGTTVGSSSGETSVHYIIDSIEELRSWGDIQTPIYIEPGQPILATFRHKVSNEALLNTPGTVFGLEVKSLSVSGGTNMTWVEVMEAVGDGLEKAPTKVIGFVTGRKESISLDVPWGTNLMETQPRLRGKLEPKAIAALAPLPTPSPAAKDVLSRLKILDTKDGPVLQVEGLADAPTPTPEINPKIVPPKDVVRGTEKQQEVSALYEGHTAVKVIDLIKPYEGQTMEINGTLFQLHGGEEYWAIIQNPAGSPVIICHFNKGWEEQLRALDSGAPIKIRGRIEPGQNGTTLVLRRCDLL